MSESHVSAQITPEEELRCPVNYHIQLKAGRQDRLPASEHAAVERDAQGVWHIYGFEEARAILRSGDTKQAGFGAESIEQASSKMGPQMMPAILYLEGKPHQVQRQQTARFFTPKTVDSNYRHLMETVADSQIGKLRRHKAADLSQLSRFMAVRVAAQIVGLTDSLVPGMDKRLDAFFTGDLEELTKEFNLRTFIHTWRNSLNLSAFFLFDVKPAIKARRRALKDDVISFLVEQGRSDAEILTECVTYAAAGMVTTREFICLAAWHLLEHESLRRRYLQAGEKERYAILHEMLRLEPIVGNLQRRATADLHLVNEEGVEYTIPADALINLHVSRANLDERATGDEPELVCPVRKNEHGQAPGAVMSFGDGVHRCPGSYTAIQETDLFLQRLLAVDGLSIKKRPRVTWSELVTGYEIRDFQLAIG